MSAAFTCFFFWLLAVSFETTVFASMVWFHPNLLFLISVIFCLHWRGIEIYFISLLFGLTADCFATTPFGTYGLVYFLFSFFIRWYSIKIYQESTYTLPIVTGLFTFIANLLVFLILIIVFSNTQYNGWLSKVILKEVLPTAVLSVPAFKLLVKIEKMYKIRLAERIF